MGIYHDYIITRAIESGKFTAKSIVDNSVLLHNQYTSWVYASSLQKSCAKMLVLLKYLAVVGEMLVKKKAPKQHFSYVLNVELVK